MSETSALRDQINLDGKDAGELEFLRRNLTTKAMALQKEGKELTEDDLILLCAVTQSLRRRAVTPKSKAAPKPRGKRAPASVADI